MTKTFTHGNTRINVPADGHLRLVVKGEESTPVDLLPFAAMLLDTVTPSGVTDEDADVEFAIIECSDDVTFERNGQPITQEEALSLLGEGIMVAVKASLSEYATS
jgi:hypothetical protein